MSTFVTYTHFGSETSHPINRQTKHKNQSLTLLLASNLNDVANAVTKDGINL
jgi:hypothetical protein